MPLHSIDYVVRVHVRDDAILGGDLSIENLIRTMNDIIASSFIGLGTVDAPEIEIRPAHHHTCRIRSGHPVEHGEQCRCWCGLETVEWEWPTT